MPLLGATVEASREKRIERQQARFRYRGGIFQPSEHNALLDILLARGVNGESPSRANSPRRSRSRSASPARKVQASRPSADGPRQAAPPRSSRQARGKGTAQQRAVGEEGAYTDHQGDDTTAAGPSKLTGHAKSERAAKLTANSQRSQSATHTSNNDSEAAITGTSKTATRKSKAPQKSTITANDLHVSESAPKRQRAAKRKPPSPLLSPEPAPDDGVPSDDEPLAPRKRARTKLSATSRPNATTTKTRAPAAKGSGGSKQRAEPRPAKLLNHRAKKAEQNNSGGASNDVDEGVVRTRKAQPSGGKLSDKGKHKAVNAVTVALAEEEPKKHASRKGAQVQKTTVKPRYVPQPADDSDAEPAAGPSSKSQKKKHALPAVEDSRPDMVRKSRLPAGGEIQPAAHVTKLLSNGEEDLETPPTHRKQPRDDPSSPDVPLARTSRSGAKRRPPEASSTLSDEEAESDPPAPARKKRRSHEDRAEHKPTGEEPSVKGRQPRQAKHPPRPDSPARIASRTKAPPILAPKGTKLKPKPKPRMSMFPAPPVDEDSDTDPIDFLS